MTEQGDKRKVHGGWTPSAKVGPTEQKGYTPSASQVPTQPAQTPPKNPGSAQPKK